MQPMSVDADSPGRWLTRANALTGVRAISAPLSAAAIWAGEVQAAAAIFVLAVITDLLDGPVARRYGEASPLGGAFDHATDATFVTLGLGALACHEQVPAALAPLIVLAFAQYWFDSRSEGGPVQLRASFLGRWNGIAYFALLGTAVIRDALGIAFPPDVAILAAGWALVATTLLSMADRLWALRSLRRARDSRAAGRGDRSPR